MNNLNEIEKFDSVFKNAAVDFELPFDESAWNSMQKKLDSKKNKPKRNLWLWIPITLAVLFAGIYFVGKNNIFSNNKIVSNGVITNPIQNSKTINSEEPAKKIVNSEISETNKNKLSVSTNVSEFNTSHFTIKPLFNSSPTIKEKNKKTNSTISKNNTSIKKRIEILANNKNNISNVQFVDALKTETVVPQNASNITKPQSITTKDKFVDDINYFTSITDLKTATKYYIASNLPSHNHYIADFEKASLENKVAIANREKELEKETVARKEAEKCHCEFLTQKRNVPSSNWYLTASVGNNISYVTNPRLDLSAFQYRFGVGYNITKYVSLQTGVIIGQRSFSVTKDQYMYPITPTVYTKFFKGASADISVIDIPINITYQFSDRENYGFYATTGFSTLFMSKENYVLLIDHNNTIYRKQQNFSNTQSILGLVNFSFGYQFPITKNFVITTEPYIQLPIQDIGNGGTKMCSVGLQFGGKYNFSKRKK